MPRKSRTLFRLQLDRLFLGDLKARFMSVRAKTFAGMDIIQQSDFNKKEKHIDNLISECDSYIEEEKSELGIGEDSEVQSKSPSV